MPQNSIDINKLSQNQRDVLARKMQFLHKNIIEQKNVSQCAKEMGVSRKTLHNYRNSEDCRQAAIQMVEDSAVKGLDGVMTKLVDKLEAKRVVVVTDKEGNQSVKNVADEKIRLDAIKELCKIYGVYAPTKTDAQITVSVQSDADIFAKIEEIERDCCFEPEYKEGPNGYELVAREQEAGRRSVESRERALLCDASVQEP
jgi:hypothetical protein